MQATYRIPIAGIAAAALFAAAAIGQTVVTGTGNPDIDIARVQSAVDGGGSIVLSGHFSFDNPPTKHGALDGLMAVVLVSKQVTISGAWDQRGEMTAIHGGEIPFAVEAPGAEVRIKGLRFVRPKRSAIFVDAAGGLAIESCIVENVEPLPPLWNPVGGTLSAGIHVTSLLGLPNRMRPGKPGNIYGKVSIANNEVSVGEGADFGAGIVVVSVGDDEKPAQVDVSGNTVRNANQEGINVKYVGGRVRIERNTVTSSTVYFGPARGPIVGIHCMDAGSYLIAHNRIEMADPNGGGIRVRGLPRAGAVTEHSISDNDVTLSAPEGALLGAGSVGIDVRASDRDNVVQENRIRGARVALYLGPDHKQRW